MRKVTLSVILLFAVKVNLFAQQDPYKDLVKNARPLKVNASKNAANTVDLSRHGKVKLRKASPIPFKPIKAEEINVPDNVKLPSEHPGDPEKTVSKKEYLRMLNDFEAKLCQAGYSLRNKGKVNTGSLELTDKNASKHLSTGKKGPVATKEQLEEKKKKDNEWAGPAKITSNTMSHTSSATPPKTPGTDSKTMKNISNTGYGKAMDEERSAAMEEYNKKNMKKLDWIKGSTYNDKPVAEPDIWKNYSDQFGDPDVFEAGYEAGYYLRGKFYNENYSNKDEMHTGAHGKLYGSILGNSLDLMNAQLDIDAYNEKSKESVGKLVLNIMGESVINEKVILSSRENIPKYFTPNLPSYPIVVPLLPFVSITGKVGLKGSMGFEYAHSITPLQVSCDLTPIASLAGFIEAGVSAAGILTVGAGGNLNFLTLRLPNHACLGVKTDQTAKCLEIYKSYYSGVDVTTLNGNMYVFGEIDYWLDSERYEFSILNWGGVSYNEPIVDDPPAVEKVCF